MLQSCGQLAVILDHMQRHSDEASDADPIPDVLRRLLRGTLAGMPANYGDDDVATAATILAAATELIGEEIFLVDEPAGS